MIRDCDGNAGNVKPRFNNDNIKELYDARFLRLYDLQYKEGAHYYDVSRRASENLVARKSDEEFRNMLPDAVTIAVVVEAAGEEPRLLLNYEYRYPVGQYLLSPIAGLIDKEDSKEEDPLTAAAKREIFEESGLRVKDTDRIEVVNPCAFSSPGMTDESNAFLYAHIKVQDLSELSQEGAEGSELFSGYELVNKEEALKLFASGRDKYGNFFSIATWVVLAVFISSAS
jgi:ADP-ribose pyrophosphatase